jgi:hypothetical protein
VLALIKMERRAERFVHCGNRPSQNDQAARQIDVDDGEIELLRERFDTTDLVRSGAVASGELYTVRETASCCVKKR